MDDKDECVLLIESDLDATTHIRTALAEARGEPLKVERVANLNDGLARLSQGGIKAILLNLSLTDSQGVETFDKIKAIACHVPIVILSNLDREVVAKLAIQRGAHDYLLTDHINSHTLTHAISKAMGRVVTEDALELDNGIAQDTLNSIGDAVISTNIAGNISYLNGMAERMTGWSLTEARGQPFSNVFRIIDSVTREALPNPMDRAIMENHPVGLPADCVLVRRDGVEAPIEDSTTPIHDLGGQVIGAVMVFRNVGATQAKFLKMYHLAQHDFLTNLPNRLLLNDRLTQAISRARRHRSQLAVLFVDVDRFKNINDTLGHLIGDKLLQSVAQRLTTCVRNSDTVSRLGGDEFVVLLADAEHAAAAESSAAKIITAMTEKHCVAEHELRVTLSIGISIFPDDGDDAETLFRNADAAMFHAKEIGRNNYQFFEQDMIDRAIERHSLVGGLRQALAHEEFVLHYQPKINLKTGDITGAEAFIRWQHPDRGLLPPNQFVPVAENFGLIVPIGQWILREACRQAQAWQNAGLRPTSVAVNISAAEFRNEGLLADIRSILLETGLAPCYLEIELAESILAQDSEAARSVLHALKSLGVKLAIDDFGIGHSSLGYLRQFPVDTLKINQLFVRDVATDHSDATIVSAVIGMGNSLKLRVSAGGVETREQLAFLQAEQCTEGQGFYFSPPLAAEAFADLLEAA